MKYELKGAEQTLKRITRHLCIEVPRPLTEHELFQLGVAVKNAPRWPKVALNIAVQKLGGRAFWDERPREVSNGL